MALTKVTYSMINRAPINPFDYGVVGDGVSDDTAALQAAFTAANGRTLDLSGGTYLITDQITMPESVEVIGVGSFICTGDEEYWFYANTPTRIVWDSFIAEVTLAFGSRAQLNRVLVCNTPEYFEIKTATITGASTAIQCIDGDDFVCGDIILFDVFGNTAQYGYGVNTSAKRTTIDSIKVVNSSAAEGRHAVYIVGDQWSSASIGNIYVNNWAANPVQIVNTDASAYGYAWVGNAVFENVNQTPTAVTTGCIHVTSAATNTGLSIASLRVRNIKGPAASSLADGDAGFWLGTLFADELPTAANASTNLIYLRFGSNKQVGNVWCSELNTDWDSAVYIRDCTESTFDQIYVGGSAGSQAVTLVDSTVLVGNIQTSSISKFLSSGSTQSYKQLQQVFTYGGAEPSTGTWLRGSIVWDTTPSAGGDIGWVCIATGTPGTWKTFGTIAA
jgi:hypothetical protein